MSRPLRLEFPGALWHITSRGNERGAIYHSDQDRRTFLEILGQTVSDAGWRLHAYVLMTNHFHLLAETPQPTLSRGMRDLNGDYAQWFNKTRDRVGHLLEGRFKGILVEKETHLLELIRYIVLNPVRAGMVRNPADHPWSSYRATAGFVAPPHWLDVAWTLAQFHPTDPTEATRRYREFVGAGAEPTSVWEELHGGMYLGSEAFAAQMQAIIDGQVRSDEHPRDQCNPDPVSLDRISDSLNKVLRIDRSEKVARLAFVYFARRRGGAPLKRIAEILNLSVSRISGLAKDASRLLLNDANFAAIIGAIEKELERTGVRSSIS